MASYYTHTRKDATPLCGYLHLYPFLALSAPSLAHVQVGDLCVVVNHPGLLDAVENRLDHVVTVWPLGVRHAQQQGTLALRQARGHREVGGYLQRHRLALLASPALRLGS